MGTRSTIALEFADGTVQQVYCHWDGYLSHNGKILFENYSNPFKLRELIDLGSLSSLRPEIGAKHAFSSFDLPKDEREAHEALVENMCTFHARDRGEAVHISKFADYADYVENFQHEEYAYILRNNGNWYVKQHEAAFEQLTADMVLERETA